MYCIMKHHIYIYISWLVFYALLLFDFLKTQNMRQNNAFSIFVITFVSAWHILKYVREKFNKEKNENFKNHKNKFKVSLKNNVTVISVIINSLKK